MTMDEGGVPITVTDHVKPCGLLQVLQAEIINVKDDVSVLYTRVDRLPNWMVFLFSAVCSCLAASVTSILFLLDRVP